MPLPMQLLSDLLLPEYREKVTVDKILHTLDEKKDFTLLDFEHYIVASSVYSSKIEGNTLDLNSFMRQRGQVPASRKKEIREIEDLVAAYRFASENGLNYTNFLKTHEILSKTLLKKSERGKLRQHQVGVFDQSSGKPVYMAVEPQYAEAELQKLFRDIEALCNSEISAQDVFYYASMLHLWCAMIHPFSDGNGRAARLLEKWFLSVSLGFRCWSINSEKMYWDNRENYYKNISLGYNYYALHWERAMPFLRMLPSAVPV